MSGARSLKGREDGRNNLFRFHDEHFNEFLVQWFGSIGIEELRMLSPEEMHNIAPKNLKNWVDNSSLDEKLVLLAKTGGQYFLVAGKNNGWKAINSEKSIFRQYYKQGDTRQKIIDLLVKEKTFVLASQQIMIGAFYMHQSCQTDFWRLNRDFQRLYALWELTNQHLTKKDSVEITTVKAGLNLAVEFAYHVNRNGGYHANLGLGTHVDVTILLFLFRKTKEGDNKTKFMSGEEIYMACNDGKYKMTGFGRRLSWLAQQGYLNKMAVVRAPRYTIADRGVQVVLEYIRKMSELVKFYQ